jgi:hypothetical protein
LRICAGTPAHIAHDQVMTGWLNSWVGMKMVTAEAQANQYKRHCCCNFVSMTKVDAT